MQNPVPASAKPISFKSSNGKHGIIWVWPTNLSRTKWEWAAMGNSGQANSAGEACEMGKRWIRDGQL